MTAGFKAICKADAVGRRARRSEEEALRLAVELSLAGDERAARPPP